MSEPAPNANVPQIQQPLANLGALVNVCQSLKQGMDSLAGHRGSTLDRAVTYRDLIALGLTSAPALATPATSSPGSVGYDELPDELQNLPVVASITDKPPGPIGGLPARIWTVPIVQLQVIPASFRGTYGWAGTPAAAPAVFTIAFIRAGALTTVGTITFAAGASTPTLSVQGMVTLLAGDVLIMLAPAAQDGTLADVGITLLLKRQ